MLRLLEKTFVDESFAEGTAPDTAWRERYAQAVERLKRAGIPTVADERAGAECYVALRGEWDADVRTLSRSMRLDSRQVDPALASA